MGRPRIPSNVLNLKGAFKRNPNRAREDAVGPAPFNLEPPSHLPQEALVAWRYLVVRLPKVALYSTDEVAVEMASRNLATVWSIGQGGVCTREYKAAEDSLMKWIGRLGFTPQDRTKIPPAPTAETGNAFDAL